MLATCKRRVEKTGRSKRAWVLPFFPVHMTQHINQSRERKHKKCFRHPVTITTAISLNTKSNKNKHTKKNETKGHIQQELSQNSCLEVHVPQGTTGSIHHTSCETALMGETRHWTGGRYSKNNKKCNNKKEESSATRLYLGVQKKTDSPK